MQDAARFQDVDVVLDSNGPGGGLKTPDEEPLVDDVEGVFPRVRERLSDVVVVQSYSGGFLLFG
jgi:hypothetical protein